MYWKLLWLACVFAPGLSVKSQDSTVISVRAYGEVYYVTDHSKPVDHNRPPFIYSHNRTGEFNVNLALLKTSFHKKNTRANLGLMVGTYPNANLAAEPGVLKNLFEANAGVRISQQHNAWLDAGVLPSHIGFESAVGKDNWTLTRSLGADNSPYYETGARVSLASKNEEWYAAVLVLNGWQRIHRVDGNTTPAFGTQVTFKKGKKLLINWSSFVGNDQPDSVRRFRYFHDLYSVAEISSKVWVTLGLDLGAEQKSRRSRSLNIWYTPVAMFRLALDEEKFLALRTEYYSDKAEVIVKSANGQPLRLWSFSSNVDWSLDERLLWRIEGRGLRNKSPAFLQPDGSYSKWNWSLATALCFSIQ